MQRRATLLTGCMLVALASSASAAAGALRCGSKVISRGDHAIEVLHYCGEPTAVQSWVAQRAVVAFGTIRVPGIGLVEEVLVEKWTYNFGPGRLMRELRLENGIVRDVEPLGYGFRER